MLTFELSSYPASGALGDVQNGSGICTSQTCMRHDMRHEK